MVLMNPPVAQLGTECAIVHGRARRYEMRGVRAPLSLKTVVRGAAEWWTAAGRFEITPGMLLLVNDGEDDSIEVDSLQPVETFCVFFAAGFVSDPWYSTTCTSAALIDTDDHESIEFRERLHFDGALLESMQHMYSRSANGEALDESMYALAELIVRASCDLDARVAALPALRSSTRTELARRLGMAMELMHVALERRLTIEDVAREACLSPFHFHRLFTAFAGETPHRYLRRLRLERAMLRSGARSVADVALSCGFDSATSFSTAFSRHFGAPPRRLTNSQE